MDINGFVEGRDYIVRDGKKYLSVSAVSKMWKPRQVEPATVYTHMRRGNLVAEVIDEHWYICEDEFAQFLNTRGQRRPGAPVRSKIG